MSMTCYTTKQVADMANIHRDTLLRWLREGRIPEPQRRDRNGWRIFSTEETEFVKKYANSGSGIDTAENTLHGKASDLAETRAVYQVNLPFDGIPQRLSKIDWDFSNAVTGYLTHSIHPYPCKFIPQIPNVLIQELSFIGDTVLDLFCGSGTTLVEALRLGRNAVGIDANPLACMISGAKTTLVTDSEIQLLKALSNEIANLLPYNQNGMQPLFPNFALKIDDVELPMNKGITGWFEPNIIEELARIKQKCLKLTPHLQPLALTAFSSIIVSVSRQDSETRYVRREKNIQSGEVYRRFVQALNNIIERLQMLSLEIDPHLEVEIHQENVLNSCPIGLVDLVVCSPPYPNAFSYHLYHRTRMEWLEMDQPKFKKDEIGSHRKYSSKSKEAATVDTFQEELRIILKWLAQVLRPNRHACFIVGDSTINGEKIRNDELLISTAKSIGFQMEANIPRRLQSSKKSFNPSIGKIHDEHIVILRNTGEHYA